MNVQVDLNVRCAQMLKVRFSVVFCRCRSYDVGEQRGFWSDSSEAVCSSIADNICLPNLDWKPPKRFIGKQCTPGSDAANAASDQGLHCLHLIQEIL